MTMSRPVLAWFTIAALLLPATVSRLYGQATTLGQIVGTVTDPSGAAIANAKVRAINTQTGVGRETATGESGNFSVLSLIPGTYSVEVTAPNFQKQVQENLRLEVAGSINLTFALTVGQVTETVMVQAEAELLKSTEASMSTTIDNSKVVELPLNGRNFNNLVRLTPGATRGQNDGGPTLNAQTWAVTGSRSDNANYTLDGTFNNGSFFKTAAIAPSIDAISEFKIQTNMSARYGAAAGANINVSIKSGTNEYHGSAYEFLRNAKMDSRAYFATRRPDFKFNQFGFTLGGPIQIPKVYDGRNRTFFFFNYEGFQRRQEATQNITIPNAAWRTGNLQYNLDGVTPLPPIYDPYTEQQTGTDAQGRPIYTRQRFPNNQIPTSRMPAYVQAYINLWYPSTLTPQTLTNTSNYVNATLNSREDNQTHTRIDHKFSDNNNFFGRVSWSDINQLAPANLPNANTTTYNKYVGVTLSDTHIFSPTAILDIRLGYLRANLGQGPTHKFIEVYQQAGLNNVPTNFRQFDFPVNFNVTGITGPGNGNLVNGPDFTYQGSISMTKIIDRHSLSFGYDYTQLRTIHDSVFLNFDFNNIPTSDPQNVSSSGHPFASFLLGTLSGGGRISGEADLDTDQKLNHLWFQDDFKVNDKLTLNLGIRWEYNAWPHHRRGRMGGFDMGSGSFYWVSQNPITGQPANAPETISEPERMNLAPRIGLAYRIFPRTVIRSAYGIFYNSNFGWEWSTGRGNWPYSISDNVTGVNIAGVPPTRADQQFQSFDPTLVKPTAQHTIARDLSMPYMQNWNFGIEHQLTQSLLVELNYQGSKGTHLSSFLSSNDPPPGPGDPNLRRPEPQGGALSELKMIGTSRYNGLTAKVEQRLSRGLSYIASYAYQKNIDLNSQFGGTSPQDNSNIKASMGPSDFDQTHVFNTGYTYTIPVGGMTGAMKYLLGGWQTTGIITLETGRPFNITLPSDIANVGSRGSFQRPNLVGDPFPDGWTPTYGPGGLYFDPRAFASPAQYTFGNLGRNAVRGPGFKNFDIGIFKNFIFSERWRLQYRAEAFNAFNNTNFSNPGGSFGTPNFGRSTGTANAQRSIQMGLKLYF
ncbi:MAG TPA: carboxypeptidase regulatory-like domain-containing protein [Bryobacteraceae bacterium]|nr:carboxypeptidase regulatory-like domain-containing protein [Bryobacteraceae bacterium]